MKNTKIIILVITLIAVCGVFYLFRNQSALFVQNKPIGGDRDEHGCLVAAGYIFNKDVGACARSFELTPDIARAAKIAVDYVGGVYALTVVSFNSYEEVGAYDIMLERGVERTKQTVYIKNWIVQSVTG